MSTRQGCLCRWQCMVYVDVATGCECIGHHLQLISPTKRHRLAGWHAPPHTHSWLANNF